MNDKLRGNNDAMYWCKSKSPVQIYEQYLRCLVAQVEAPGRKEYLDAFVLGIEKYIKYCINTKQARPEDFKIVKSF